jgi:hypothetical protein
MLYLVYHHDKGNAGSGLLRTNLENDDSILSTRQLATDSTSGIASCSGARRAREDVICLSFRGGTEGDLGIEYVRGPDSVIMGWPILHEHCCMLKSKSIRSSEILTRPQKIFLIGVVYPSVTAPVVQGIVVSITGILESATVRRALRSWSKLLD